MCSVVSTNSIAGRPLRAFNYTASHPAGISRGEVLCSTLSHSAVRMPNIDETIMDIGYYSYSFCKKL
jgi:hypothetical protein